MADLHTKIGAALDREQALAEKASIVEPEYWGALLNDYIGGDVGAYCAAQGPARTLRRVEADRRVLARHEPLDKPGAVGTIYCRWCFGKIMPCPDLLDLAARCDVTPEGGTE